MSQHFKPRPTHVCTLCGAAWKYHEDGGFDRPSWQLVSDDCGKCCDNVTMGSQIVEIPHDGA